MVPLIMEDILQAVITQVVILQVLTPLVLIQDQLSELDQLNELLLKKYQLKAEYNIFLSRKNILSMTESKELKEFLLKEKLSNINK
jgi:hypothetical protein